MGKVVTIPKEKQKRVSALKIKDVTDKWIMQRMALENTRRWIEDPTRDEIISMGIDRGPSPKLSPEKIEEMTKAGAGSYGHTTVIEPADLDLYRSYMYPPLSMPEKPEVMVSYWDMNNAVIPFLEGRVMVKALCPDGIESWLVISVPVPTFSFALNGNVWGWPKYVADEMTVTPERSEVIYEGDVRLSMDFTPGNVDEATVQQLKERGTERGNTISFHVDGGGGCLIRQGRGDNSDRQGTHFVEWQAGMVKTYMRPEDRCSGLIPANCVTPGVYQKSFATGGGEGVMCKVKVKKAVAEVEKAMAAARS